ncbi:MAG TPA: flagellar cap protein FliD N-terminal domain-containing protein, partial [Tepidisphaeraceae bacterium]
MGTITSGVGLVSGLNSKDIIDQLMSIEGRRKDLVQARIDAIDTQKTAYLDVSTRLTSLRLSAQSFSKPSFFTAATATSSNEDVITATAAKGAAVGSYQFQVARLVQSQQLVSRGMSNPDKAAVGAGTLTLEMGGGEVTQQNLLSDLRGGQGISGGKIRITDMTGKNAVVDLSDAVTLDDVIKKINTAVDVNVEAKVVGDRLTLTDRSNGFDSDLVVQDIGTTTTAADLGLAGSNILGQISGSVINYVGRDTKLASLNDGNGVSNRSGNDFKITFAD